MAALRKDRLRKVQKKEEKSSFYRMCDFMISNLSKCVHCLRSLWSEPCLLLINPDNDTKNDFLFMTKVIKKLTARNHKWGNGCEGVGTTMAVGWRTKHMHAPFYTHTRSVSVLLTFYLATDAHMRAHVSLPQMNKHAHTHSHTYPPTSRENWAAATLKRLDTTTWPHIQVTLLPHSRM